AVAISADGRYLLTSGGDFTARVWETATGAPAGPPFKHPDQGQWTAAKLAFHPGGSICAAAFNNQSILVWEMASGKEVQKIPGLHRLGLAFHPDGKTIVSAPNDVTIERWDFKTKKAIATINLDRRELGHPISAFTLREDGKVIAVATGSKISLWSAETGK